MTAVVIDTNVLHVANSTAQQAGPECVLAVVERLEKVRLNDRVCLDDTGFILEEYAQQQFSFSGEPGVGDAFFKWLSDNQANPHVCEIVHVTSTDASGTQFDEFPDDPALANFDRSDRKFVAVVLASDFGPTVLNAVDSDWWIHREALARNSVRVEFLCPDQFDA